ncbi:glycine-rich domain-containing protein [Microvirgula aerodenitrificans]|uniref:glycine-rich domain-containing protein n=1 Tax=Microvirgula aerodenitrificans TaxID=57480 RepID=UPI0012EBE4B2|nr:hypothetical protein [Microvirgula aerodenitrificans]
MNKGIHGYPKGGVTAVTPNWGNGRFDTTPVVTNFSHTVPSFMGKGATANITFRSAADASGGAVSFSIDSQTSGLTFSKTTGIAANEIVVMSAPGQMPAAREVAFVVNVVTTSGGKTPVTIKVIILETVMWEFTTAGVSNWTAPVSGIYELLVIGGGGAGGLVNGGGGGSGWPDKIEASVAAGQTLAVTVGSGGIAKTSGGTGGVPNDPTCTGGNGGVSSIGTLISAMGGQGGSGGGAYGGNYGGSGGSGGGGGGGNSTEYPSGSGGTNGSNGQTPVAKSLESKGGAGAGANRYSLLDSSLTHGTGGNSVQSHGGGGGGGGWGPMPAAITTAGTTVMARGGTGAGYGAGGGGGGWANAGANGVSGYVRIKCIGADHV